MSKYLDWVDRQIDHHQREIAALTIARKILVAADKEFAPAQPKLRTLPKEKLRHRPRVVGKTRTLIMDAVATLGDGPWDSRTITDAVKAAHPEVEDKALWNAMYNAKRVGQLVQDPTTKLYSLPENNSGVNKETENERRQA
jgi:hypothetical protein